MLCPIFFSKPPFSPPGLVCFAPLRTQYLVFHRLVAFISESLFRIGCFFVLLISASKFEFSSEVKWYHTVLLHHHRHRLLFPEVNLIQADRGMSNTRVPLQTGTNWPRRFFNSERSSAPPQRHAVAARFDQGSISARPSPL